MTLRHLTQALLITVALLPALASATSDDAMLQAFGEAVRSLPPAPTPVAKPQPKPAIKKPLVQPEKKSRSLPENGVELSQLRKKLSDVEKQKAELKQQNEKLREQQAASDKKLAELRAESEKQSAALTLEKEAQAKHIAALTTDLKNAQKPPHAQAPLGEPKSDAERDGYTLGQFIASNAVVQLQMVKDMGLHISMDQLIAGVTTQLKTGTSAMSGEEMSRRYAAIQESLNKGMASLIEKGYAQLNKQTGNRKALMTLNGVRWFALKSVKSKLIPDQQVEISLNVSTLSGKVINEFTDDKVQFEDSLPPLLHDGMSLTGKGGAVEGWALAKDIFEREPLPQWVAPYDVIHYQLAIK